MIGFPRILQSDNGTEFVNSLVKTMSNNLGVNHRLLTPYHPRGNGVAERHVKSAVDILKKEFHQKHDAWDLHIPVAQLAMNTRIVALHNSSPFSLFFARRFNGFHNFTDDKNQLLSHKELCERLTYMTEIVFPAIDKLSRKTQQKMIDRFNATVLHNQFPEGSKVMTLDPIRNGKLDPKYEGPYTVVRRTTGGTYQLKDGTGAPLGRNYAPSQLKLVLEDPNSSQTFEIEKILGHRPHPTKKGEWQYSVKWKGYSEEDNTWEPQESFIERTTLKQYWSKQNVPKAPKMPARRKRTATSTRRSNRKIPSRRR